VEPKSGLYRMADVVSRAASQEHCRAEGKKRGFWAADDAVLTRFRGAQPSAELG